MRGRFLTANFNVTITIQQLAGHKSKMLDTMQRSGKRGTVGGKESNSRSRCRTELGYALQLLAKCC